MLFRCLLVWLSFTSITMAASPLSITPGKLVAEQKYYDMSQALQLLEDTSGQLTIEQVTNSPTTDEFYEAESSFAYSPPSTPVWARFSLHNSSANPQALRLKLGWRYSIKKATLYSMGPNGKYQVSSSNHQYPPLDPGSVPSMDLFFDITLSAQQTSDFYLRLQPALDYELYSELRLWSVETSRTAQNSRKAIYISFFATILLMTFYNFFIYLSLKDRAYLSYVAYLVFLNLEILCLNGVLEAWFWPDSSEVLIHLYVVFDLCAIVLFCQFGRDFLNTAENFPVGDWLFRGLMFAAGMFIPVSFFLPITMGETFQGWLSWLLEPALLLASSIVWWRGAKAAKYYLLANILLFVSVILSLLFDRDLITHPFFEYDFFLLSSILAVTLLSFALAARISELEQIALDAQRQLLEEAQTQQKMTEENLLLAQDNARMNAELAITAQLQQMVLPKKAELGNIPELDVAGYMQPADEIGGDYYDVLHYRDKTIVCIGDVTGHGLANG
ncbi:MAG: 7TM diverse intracellular signaling domain-containing protein, partial [Pseudomonadota bacterium]